MAVLQDAEAGARASRAKVVFPEWDEPRIAAARTRLVAQGLAEPVPVGPVDDAQRAALLRARPGMKPGIAERMLARPLIRAAAMVGAGQAAAMVAGADHPTAKVIEAALLGIGLAPGVALPSSFFLMVFPDGRELIFADCAVNTDPDDKALAAIARASAASAAALLGRARVALLSYSTGRSGSGPSVDRVRAAAEAAGAAGLEVTGPVQADAALNAAIAHKKGVAAAEPANTLIFPDLDAGNIAYKLCQELAGAQAVGPFLQGFARPVCDLSRGASVDDIVAATTVTLSLAQDGQEAG
ncbi:MAG: phosphate acetyltransferase [Alphaproteobacteria bacterium]|nr:MAG: phosphate acetyltransferase [Alphaproteobacteria bacterium]